jgi:hypothetical protein
MKVGVGFRAKEFPVPRASIAGIVIAAAIAGAGCRSAAGPAIQTTPGAATQAGPACLHAANESPAERARRAAAIGFVRGVNDAQARALGQKQEVVPLASLPPAPAGFQADLGVGTERTKYVLTVKDTTDPCRYALFTDQAGLIYSGGPLQ